MPLRVQLVFQGGGAKLALLLAAAEAVRELENAGEIKVTRIAGTSAGAIVGAFLAADCDLAAIRAELSGDVGRDFLKQFKLPNVAVGTVKAAAGKPFWLDTPLRDWLSRHFKPFDDSVGHPFTFEDLPKHGRPELIVVATNLSTGRRHEPSAKSDVVGALLASAGIPICFRTWKSGSQEILVDGGLCKNLPVETLLNRQENDGSVLAFTFNQPRPKLLKGLKEFGISLLDAAINDSVESSRVRLGENYVHVLGANARDVTTFAFNEALAFLRDDTRYGETKAEVKVWLRGLAAREHRESHLRKDGVVMQDLWRRPVSDESYRMMESVGRIYHQIHGVQPFRYVRMRVMVVANCLAKADEPGYREPDIVDYSLEFEPAAHPVSAHRMTLSNDKDKQYIADYSVSHWSERGDDVKMEVMGAVVPDSPDFRSLVAFFLPPLQPGTGVYGLRLKDKGVDLYSDLETKGRDFLSLELDRALGPVPVIEVAMVVPKSFRPLKLGLTNVANLRRMTDAELGASFGPPEPGLTTWAWRAENFAPRVVRIEFKT
jgi:predicted acylesterase/phospholipase RssA